MQAPICRLGSLGLSCALTVLAAVGAGGASAAPLALSDVPLFVTTGADPNVMLMIDNSGSMQNIVPDDPYDPNVEYLSNCPTSDDNRIPANSRVELRMLDGNPRIRYDDDDYRYGTGTGRRGSPRRCFVTGWNYLAKLYADDDGETTNYLPAQYTGNYLNWYFNQDTDPWRCPSGWNSGRKPCTQSRMMIAKTAGKNLVSNLTGAMRTGLSTYNNGVGGRLIETVGRLDADKRATLRSQIDALAAGGNTPLAETLADIGFYLSRGAESLVPHPGSNADAVDRGAFFDNGYTRHSSWSNGSNPIQYSCQKSFAVLLTDGRPHADQNMSVHLADYDGDCSSPDAGCLDFDRKPDREYESLGSDYLDDVAAALYDMDLRPDLISSLGVTNNLATYLISFADDQAINDPLMPDAAASGGGDFFVAGNEAQLTAAFNAAVEAIIERSGSAAAASVNGSSISGSTRIYQAKFDSSSWTGQLLSFPVRSDGTLGAAEWDAARRIPAADDRHIITVNTDGSGVAFRWGSLDASRRLQLDPSFVYDSALGTARLDYVRGDASNEGAGGRRFRARAARLGDIVGSAPTYAGEPRFAYRDSLEKKPYSAFRIAHSDLDGVGPDQGRQPILYVGANDGMLHAFDAASGREVFAFIPGAVFGNLRQLADAGYSHRYYVDGPPVVGDAFVDGEWRTVLVGGLNKGGQAIYALDITDPSTFDEDDADDLVLWEFTDADADSSGITGDADLGFTYSQPAIVRLHNGKWGAVFGNGYNNTAADGSASTSGNAVLFIVDIETGRLMAKLDTKVGYAEDPTGRSRPNGLATPAVVDINGDQIVDYVYAGDLFGNLWKFDVRSESADEWGVAYANAGRPLPLFAARDPVSDAAQPITARPEVIRGPRGVGMMVLFGTGKYLEPVDSQVDPDNPEIQSYYGLFDRNTGADSDRIGGLDELVAQSIEDEISVSRGGRRMRLRVTTNKPLENFDGWYLPLLSPDGYEGERQVSNTVVRSGRVIFTTLIPDPDPCGFGGESWLMELDALSGGRLGEPPFDLNNDGKFDESDRVGDPDSPVPPSGMQTDSGITPEPGILLSEDGTQEFKYNPGSRGNITITVENPGKGATGRQSWRQLR